MKWEEAKGLRNGQFRRLTGVNRALFEMMVHIISTDWDAMRRHPSRGLKTKLCIEDQILLTSGVLPGIPDIVSYWPCLRHE